MKKGAAEIDASPGVGFLLARAHGLFRERMMKLVSVHGLHMGHILILSMLLKHPAEKAPLTQTYLGKLTGIEKSSLVIFLDELEKQSWVRRVRHPGDRRAYVIKPTETGSERFKAISLMLNNCEHEILAFLSKSQQAVFAVFLTELIDKLQQRPASD